MPRVVSSLLFVALVAVNVDPALAQGKPLDQAGHGSLWAGVAKVDITNTKAGLVNDPLYVKALVLKKGPAIAVLVTVDAVAIGEIGHIGNDYLGKVRARLEKDLGIPPTSLIVNASHCHGIVCADVDERTVRAVTLAAGDMLPVSVGVGVGHENRIMENRRVKLKNGKEADVRHAYSLPPNDEIAEVGPTDPMIGILRLDMKGGKTLAVVYNFACHPIQGVPNGGNTADITGFASKVIEDNLSEGAIALFVQGCGGDINPVRYKDVHSPRDAEPLGNLLGLSVLQAVRKITTKECDSFQQIHESLKLPRADLADRIVAMEAEQGKLLRSLQGTSLSLETFLPLLVKYEMGGEYPSYSAHRYLHEKKIGREELAQMDTQNRRNLKAYTQNILIMEQLTRLQTNLTLLKRHHATTLAAERKPLEVEIVGLRVGDFVLVTFPGELTVEIGLNIKKASPHPRTFVAGYTNGYIYYSPTAQQLRNRGNAQEDSDCLLAPEWQQLFEDKVAQMLKRL